MKPESFNQTNRNREFLSLSMSVPTHIHTAKYKEFYSILVRILSVKNQDCIILDDSEAQEEEDTEEFLEIYPRIYFPRVAWLKGEIAVAESRTKAKIISDINDTIENGLTRDTCQLTKHDETSLQYYKKIISAYDFCKQLEASEKSEETLVEEVEEDVEENINTQNTQHRLSDRFLIHDLQLHSVFPFQHLPRRQSIYNTHGPKRYALAQPAFNSPSEKPTDLTISHSIMLFDETTGKRENARRPNLNAIISKSKIYNKLRRHRDLSASLGSNTTTLSELPISNRNSISTTMTSISNPARRKDSLKTSYRAMRTNSNLSFNRKSEHNLNATDKANTQREKFEYYVQLKRLALLVRKIIRMLNKSVDSYELVKYLDFINQHVLKFVIFDALLMISCYALFKIEESTYTTNIPI